jgi:hypothetical protein
MGKFTLTSDEWLAYLDQLILSPLLSANTARRIITQAKLFSDALITHNLGRLTPEACLTVNDGLQIAFRNEQFHFDIDIYSYGVCDWIFVDKINDTSFGGSDDLDAAYLEYLIEAVNFSVFIEKAEEKA